jgi:hypothetical protein
MVMRSVRILSGAALVLFLGGFGHAEPMTEAPITEDVVEVFSGPGPDFYRTAVLYKARGDKVKVLQEGPEVATGWVAIAPPAGSFSWVNARDVKLENGQTAVVTVPSTLLSVGSKLFSDFPYRQKFYAKQGTMLTVIGKAEKNGNDAWLPVLPAPGEMRYIQASAIRGSAVVQQTAPPPAATTSFGVPRPPAPASSTGDLRALAENAEKSGNLKEAIALYEKLAGQEKRDDVRLWYLNHCQYLRDEQRGAAQGSLQQAGATQAAYTNRGADARMASPPGYGTGQPAGYYPPSRPGMSQYCYVPDSGYSARLAAPVVTSTPPPATQTTYSTPASSGAPPTPAAPQARWYGPASLRRTGFPAEYKIPYALVNDSTGDIVAYVAPGANLSLEPYVYKTVQIYGPATYHGESRKDMLTALQVAPLR